LLPSYIQKWVGGITLSKQLGVRIPTPQIWEGFKRFVEEKKGRTYAVLGEEVEEALKHYMDYYEYEWREIMITTSNTPPPIFNGNSQEEGLLPSEDRKLLKHIINNFGEGAVVSFSIITKAMIKECGWVSVETHRNHLNILIAHGFLKDLGSDEYEIIRSNKEPVLEEMGCL
jgi:hypothetical protein